MKSLLTFLVIGILIFSTIAVSGSASLINNADSKADYVPGQVAVLIKESRLGDSQVEYSLKRSSPIKIDSIEKLHKYNLEPSSYNHGKRSFTLHFDENIDPRYVADYISKNSLVLIAEPEYIGYAASIPNDPLFPDQWGLTKIQAPEAWDIESGNQNIIISVIDTGVDLDHEDLVDKLLPGWDFVGSDDTPEDLFGHGTRMTGIASAITNNNIGVAGACPNCMILSVRAGDQNGIFYPTRVRNALIYSVGNPDGMEGIPDNQNIARIISMSIIFDSPSQNLLDGVQTAYNAGANLVAAAGNNGNNNPKYPAAYPEVIAVAATDQNDQRESSSNYGSWVDIAAPGVSIMTTTLNNEYTTSMGTSPATPFVSGTAALILSFNPILTQEEIRQLLINTSDPVYGFPQIIGGRVNAYEALLATPEPNMAPDLFPMDDVIVEETEIVVILAQAIDPNGDELNFSINSPRFYKMPLPPDGNIQQVQFVWYTGYEDEGIYEFEVSVTDGQLGDTEPVTVVVNNRPQDQGKPPPYEQYIPEQGY